MARANKPNEIARELLKEVNKKVNLKKLTRRDLSKIGEATTDAMLDNIKKGISPITGKRFPAYKNPDKYPGGLKPPRPVNLELDGDFLADLEYKVKTGKRPRLDIGYFTSLSAKKEKGHREGANGQPKRPTIPKGKESFSKKITLEIAEEFADVLSKAIAK